MRRIPVYVGMDYHKECIQVCVVNRGGQLLCNRSSKNDWHSVVELAEELDILPQLKDELAPWFKKYERDLSNFGISF